MVFPSSINPFLKPDSKAVPRTHERTHTLAEETAQAVIQRNPDWFSNLSKIEAFQSGFSALFGQVLDPRRAFGEILLKEFSLDSPAVSEDIRGLLTVPTRTWDGIVKTFVPKGEISSVGTATFDGPPGCGKSENVNAFKTALAKDYNVLHVPIDMFLESREVRANHARNLDLPDKNIATGLELRRGNAISFIQNLQKKVAENHQTKSLTQTLMNVFMGGKANEEMTIPIQIYYRANEQYDHVRIPNPEEAIDGRIVNAEFVVPEGTDFLLFEGTHANGLFREANHDENPNIAATCLISPVENTERRTLRDARLRGAEMDQQSIEAAGFWAVAFQEVMSKAAEHSNVLVHFQNSDGSGEKARTTLITKDFS